MKTFGLIGGLGPEATADYYKRIIAKFNELNQNGDLNNPEIIIYSVNMSVFIGHLKRAEYQKAAQYLATCLNRLQTAGAQFAAITANTPHLLFREIQQATSLPLISIVEAVHAEAKLLNIKRAALIGTGFTMKSTFYAEAFKPSGIDIITPNSDEMEVINQKLFTEMELGIFKPETKQQILDILQNMQLRHQIDAVILGCTEFPLMFDAPEYLGLPFLNTTQIHVDALIKACLD